MSTTTENVKKFFLILIRVLIGILAVIGFLGILSYFETDPTKPTVPIIIFIFLMFGKEIGYFLLVLLSIWTVYWLLKDRQTIKKKAYILLSLPVIGYVLASGFVYFMPSIYGRCDYYNEELNGGVKEYQGRKFKVNLCGTDDYDGRFHYRPDEIRLQVFNEKGDLLALRHFEVDWRSSFDRAIKYHPDHITYFDESSEEDFEKTISMPPTTLDWIRARLPLFN